MGQTPGPPYPISQRLTVRPHSFPFSEELGFPLAGSQAPQSCEVWVFSHANQGPLSLRPHALSKIFPCTVCEPADSKFLLALRWEGREAEGVNLCLHPIVLKAFQRGPGSVPGTGEPESQPFLCSRTFLLKDTRVTVSWDNSHSLRPQKQRGRARAFSGLEIIMALRCLFLFSFIVNEICDSIMQLRRL